MIFLLIIETFEHFELRSQEKCFRMCGRYGKKYRWKYIQVFKIYILSIVTHLQNLETWQKKSCKLLYRCIYLCQQDIKLYASNYNLIVQQKQFTVFDMSKNLFVVVNKCHLISQLSSCSTCHLLKGMSLWHFHQCRVVTSYGDTCFCWYI